MELVVNLEDLNLVELNVQEVLEVEGGFFGPWWVGAGRVNIVRMYDFGDSVIYS